MKFSIFQYELPYDWTIQVPKTSYFLKIINQRGRAVAYFIVDPMETEKKDIEFKKLLTGEKFDFKDLCGWEYITTLVYRQGDHIEHIFMKKENK